MGKFSRIESLEITKNHPDKISISIQEKEVAEILCNGSKEELGGAKTLNYKFSECFFTIELINFSLIKTILLILNSELPKFSFIFIRKIYLFE